MTTMTDPARPEANLDQLPTGYDDHDGPRWVPPTVRPFYRVDAAEDRRRLADPAPLHKFARDRVILARYDELCAEETSKLRKGIPLMNRIGGPTNVRRYPPNLDAAHRMIAVGTDYVFDPRAITEDMVQDYLHACRLAVAADAARKAQNRAASEAAHRAKTTCEVCGYPARNTWGIAKTQLRDDFTIQAHPECVRTVTTALEVRERAEITADGRTRGEASEALVTRYLARRA